MKNDGVTRRKSPKLSLSDRIAAQTYGARAVWPSGFQLYQRGQKADGLFIVCRGHVVLRTPIKGGRGFVSALAMAGETFGAEGLVPDGQYATEAIVANRAETVHLTAEQFRAFVRERPSEALPILAQIMAERTALFERLHEMASMNVEDRLVMATLRLSDDPAFMTEDGFVTLNSSHQRLLCEMVGATRESTTLALSRLVASGAARRSGSAFLVDPDQLLERMRSVHYEMTAPLHVSREMTA